MGFILLFTTVGFVVGSFPTGVVLTRRKYGIDVREMGSGNIGATNVTRVFGWYAGALVFFVDFLKGFVPLILIRKYYPEDPWLLAAAGGGLVLGHCFSLFLKFKGGKGVATSLGCLSAVAPGLALVATATYGVLLGLTKISAVGSLSGIVVILGYLALFRPPAYLTFLILFIAIIVMIRHRSNIQRLFDGRKSKT